MGMNREQMMASPPRGRAPQGCATGAPGGGETPPSPALYRWYWKARLPERRGELFRLLARGTLNSCLIEFLSDGWRVVTSRNALRKA